jgi:hypothetical protein
MKIRYIVVSAFLIIFYPRQLTNLICFGRHRDKNIVKSKAVYWGIYLFWTIIFLIGCLMMGSAMKVNSAMDKVVYYFILGSDNRDCAELGSEENDEAYISTYYTRKEINESFLLEVVQKHEYSYELCQLQDLIIKKQNERWVLYLNDDVMGYIEVKKGFLINEFCIVWDRKKIDQRRYGICGLISDISQKGWNNVPDMKLSILYGQNGLVDTKQSITFANDSEWLKGIIGSNWYSVI